jgi:predicted RNA polymerase sigma factor
VAGRSTARCQGMARCGRLAQVPRCRPRRNIPAGKGTRRGGQASGRSDAATDDTLWLYFLCAHPSLSPGSAVALTLRAVGGLTTRQIATAYLVPEATMAQRISRAKRRITGLPLDQPGYLTTVLRVLYLVFNEGYSGDIDLAAEAIRLTRQLGASTDVPEVSGLLALMLLHYARRASRTGPGGRLVPLAEQDRSRWDTGLIAEGVAILQTALARDRLGEYQAQAAIAALHADAPSTSETDWVQIVEWYDELLLLTASPVVRLNRAVALGEADGPRAGLAALAELDPELPRHPAVRAYLLERAGDLEQAAALYAEASRSATNVPERDHLTREAAWVRQVAALLSPVAAEPYSTSPVAVPCGGLDTRELRHSFVSLLSSEGSRSRTS